jgi:hypothetical protein
MLIGCSYNLLAKNFYFTQAGTAPALRFVFHYTVIFTGPVQEAAEEPDSNSELLRLQSH